MLLTVNALAVSSALSSDESTSLEMSIQWIHSRLTSQRHRASSRPIHVPQIHPRRGTEAFLSGRKQRNTHPKHFQPYLQIHHSRNVTSPDSDKQIQQNARADARSPFAHRKNRNVFILTSPPASGCHSTAAISQSIWRRWQTNLKAQATSHSPRATTETQNHNVTGHQSPVTNQIKPPR